MTAVLFLLRAVILVLLWGFVIAAIVAVRQDVFGTRRAARTATATAPAPSRRAAKAAARPAAAPERKRGKSPRQLVVVDGDLAGQSFPLTGEPITIGRAPDSTVVLTDDYVSNRHARLVPEGDGWLLEDLGSTNGTYLGRQRLTGAERVQAGVPIRVGKTVMELRS